MFNSVTIIWLGIDLFLFILWRIWCTFNVSFWNSRKIFLLALWIMILSLSFLLGKLIWCVLHLPPPPPVYMSFTYLYHFHLFFYVLNYGWFSRIFFNSLVLFLHCKTPLWYFNFTDCIVYSWNSLWFLNFCHFFILSHICLRFLFLLYLFNHFK